MDFLGARKKTVNMPWGLGTPSRSSGKEYVSFEDRRMQSRMQSSMPLGSIPMRSMLVSDEKPSTDDSNFHQLISEITKQFTKLSKENAGLKEEVQKLQQGEATAAKVKSEPRDYPGAHPEKDDVAQDFLAMRTCANAGTAGTEIVNGYLPIMDENAGHGDAEFFPEWPLNLSMQGRSSRLASGRWQSLKQPLQVPLKLVEAIRYDFEHGSCLISPNGYFRLTWDFVSCTVLFVQLWLTSFSLAFTPEAGAPILFFYIEDYTTLFFIIDMVLNFNTGIICEVEDYDWIVMNRRAIAKDYCSFFFWVDFVSTMPFDRLVQNESHTQIFSMVRLMRVVRWLKLLRFLRLTRLLRMIRSISKSFELEIERLKKNFFFPLAAVAIIAMLAHVNACILQALNPKEVLIDNMYEVYFQRLTHVLLALIAGSYPETSEHIYILDLSMAVERLAMLSLAGCYLVYQAMLLLEHAAKNALIKEDVLFYMEQRKVSHKTQLLVLNQLNEASKLSTVKRSYETWIASGIPVELERMICRELWLPRLRTLGLIEHVIHMKWQLKDELVLIVREETLAKHNILFVEGALPLGAYLVLTGVIRADSSLTKTAVPPFTADMWVGEKALVSPDMVRTLTCVCQTTCTLMAVPAHSFRKLLLDYAVLGQFEDYCVQKLWLGICGRCGVVGDHFAHECPLLCSANLTAMYTSLVDEESDLDNDVSQLFPHRQTSSEGLVLEGPVPQERLTKPDLKEFLRFHKLQYLLPELEICGVWSLSDLLGLSPERLNEMIANAADVHPDADQEDLRKRLSVECIELFQDSLEDRAKRVLGTTEQRSQHLIFLSHHKLDCGTEASLLRQELELQIRDDLRLRIMDVPVFLDTENLTNLQELTDHVANTHNIVLLLSKDVLTRPWVLVELVTAARYEVPVVPAEIRKPGHQFRFPDAKFYNKLATGDILSPSSLAIFENCGISLEEVEWSIRRVFDTICIPYSPHRPAQHRKVEVSDILRHCDYHPDVGKRQRRSDMSTHLFAQ